jgi:hypothetical protein
MELLGLVVGALIPTAILSRLWLWVLKRWLEAQPRILLAAVLTWICSLIGAVWYRGEFRGLDFAVYGVATAFWARIDLYRLQRGGAGPAKSA